MLPDAQVANVEDQAIAYPFVYVASAAVLNAFTVVVVVVVGKE